MRPWEETWGMAHYESGGILTTELHVGDGQHTCIPWADSRMGDGAEEDAARARLASAAPDMARLLFARWQKHAEDDAGNDSSDWYCLACGKGGLPHAPDCALVAALQKAGVIDAPPPVPESKP
jgi:hypothetical protein